MQRRNFIRSSLAGAALLGGLDSIAQGAQSTTAPALGKLTGRLKQSVSRWCYGGMSLDELCKHAADIGLVGIDLLDEHEWDVPAKYGLVCTMPNGPGGITQGWNRLEHHAELVEKSKALLPKIAAGKIANMIVFSGNRGQTTDADGLRNCVTGLKLITPLAEKLGVTLCMEFLNSRHDHADYQFDHTAFGVEICKQVGSPRMKLLYDLYHVQIMEGDLIQRIRDHKEHIAHYHTGGVPGRNEIDETQEINYRAVAKAILETGFTGFLAHEFVPARDPVAALRQAAEICDV